MGIVSLCVHLLRTKEGTTQMKARERLADARIYSKTAHGHESGTRSVRDAEGLGDDHYWNSNFCLGVDQIWTEGV